MASVRKSAKKHSSSSPGSTRTAEENPGASIVKNTFVNDGSFLELFKRRMEAESSQKLQPKSGSTVDDREDDEGETKGDEGSSQEKLSEGKVPGPSISLTQQGKRTFAVGKMGGASRQMHAKKKKQEKDAAEAVKKAEEEAEGKSSAWKAYMEEVKRYKEMTCSEDGDRVCPLVK
ncbi:hypothetical protein OS493_023181 [Desmophyllum pertusum]|uniref:Telomerase RNA component interacting RNase n=1 Tax=Desmophyllum pertusum TaxID=174260 RepID=A0A9W9YYB4_9CNID|nr:hypothetical protein OS493_023181 [Desmophyllum pertusum]